MSQYADELMAKVGLDTTDFKKGITDLNAGCKHIETQFQATAAMMGNWGNSSDGLKARLESLNDKLTLQKKKLEILNQEYQKAVKEHGENSAAAQKLAADMGKCGNQIKSTENQIKKYNTQLKNLETTADKVAKKLTTVGDKMSSVGSKMTMGITAPLIAAGTAAFNLSSDMTEAMNKVDVAFGNSGDSVKKWSEETTKNFGIAKVDALNAAALYGDMATSMGFSQSKAAEMSKTLVGLSGDMASFKNVSIDVAQTALKSVFTGETESLKNLGVVMTEANLQEYAYAKGINKKISAMTQAEKVQLRYNYVLENTANSQGDYLRTFDESAANQIRTFQAEVKNLGAAFGEDIVPMITPVVSKLTEFIKYLGSLDDKTKKTIVTTAAFAAAAGPVVLGLGKVISTTGKAITAIKKMSAVTKTASSGLGQMGTAAKGAGTYLGVAIAAITAIMSLQKWAADKDQEQKEKYYQGLIDKSNEYYDGEIEKLNNQVSAVEQASDKVLTAKQNEYDKLKEVAKDYEKSQKKYLQDEEKRLQKAHSAQLKRLEEEKNAKLKLIEADKEKRTSELQSQIDAIDEQTALEDKAIKERENAEKLQSLKQAIDDAETIEDKQKAEREYADFVEDLEREKTLERREQVKQQLQDQIDTITAEAEAKEEQINSDYEKNKEAAEAKYEVEKENLEKRIEALDGYAESVAEKLDAEYAVFSSAEEAKTQKVTDEVNKRIEQYQREKEEREKHYQDLIDGVNNGSGGESSKKGGNGYSGGDGNTTKQSFSALNLLQNMFNKNKGANGGSRGIGHNASGTGDWRGGWTEVNERGGEIINLPRHTQIIPHDVSMAAARTYAAEKAKYETVNNYNQLGAQRQVTVLQIGAKKVATVVTPTVSSQMNNNSANIRRGLGR